ncbi:snake venom serine protease nikobin [Striga asiatica]|uniref:Snake venom serine protease nikobin n=1 Tax=Striga asiatica TaxID=4170 RepID=A0A5A7QJP9_STRAF|nr:snake venom serine protease nikobin [Striga asiatica]
MRDLRADSLLDIILLCLLSFIMLSCCSSASSEVELLLRLVCCWIWENLDVDCGGAGNVPIIWLYLEMHSPTRKKGNLNASTKKISYGDTLAKFKKLKIW